MQTGKGPHAAQQRQSSSSSSAMRTTNEGFCFSIKPQFFRTLGRVTIDVAPSPGILPAHTYSWQQAGRGERKMFARQGGGKSANEGKKKGQLLGIGGRAGDVEPCKRAAQKVH